MTVLFEEARVQAACGRLDEALGTLDRILAAEPRQAGALMLKASVLLERRQDEAALALSRRAVEAAPESAEARNGLARCLHAMARHEDALAAAREAKERLGLGDNFRYTAPVYLTLVWCLRDLRRYREAVAMAEEGLLRCPDAVLAQWATVVEEELAESEQERC